MRTRHVTAVLFLIFNEGYLGSDPGKEPLRSDLTLEAIRLTRLLRALLPADGEVAGLLALMLLTEARRSARISASGELVRERLAVVAAHQGQPGRYQILPPSTRCTPPPGTYATPTGPRSSPSMTSSRIDSSPVVALNRAGHSPSSTDRRWRWP